MKHWILIAALAASPFSLKADSGLSATSGQALEAGALEMQEDPGAAKGWLDLTAEQQGKLKEERQKHQEAMKGLREKRRGLMDSLATQVKEKAGDAALAPTLSQLESAQKEIQNEQERHANALKGILSPSQQAKLLLGWRHAAVKQMLRKRK